MTEQDNVVVLTDEEGKEYEFQVIDMLEMAEEQYAILLPAEEEANEAIILKVGEDDEGQQVLFEIENDDEWELVANAWQENLEDDEGKH